MSSDFFLYQAPRPDRRVLVADPVSDRRSFTGREGAGRFSTAQLCLPATRATGEMLGRLVLPTEGPDIIGLPSVLPENTTAIIENQPLTRNDRSGPFRRSLELIAGCGEIFPARGKKLVENVIWLNNNDLTGPMDSIEKFILFQNIGPRWSPDPAGMQSAVDVSRGHRLQLRGVRDVMPTDLLKAYSEMSFDELNDLELKAMLALEQNGIIIRGFGGDDQRPAVTYMCTTPSRQKYLFEKKQAAYGLSVVQ